jgi:uncharacterized repeat protein (TIGR01451 family)
LFKKTALVIAGAAVLALVMFGISTRDTDVTHAQVPYFALDAVEDTGWCDTIDDTASVFAGAPHQVAICAVDHTSPYPGAGFNVDVSYDDSLNSGPELDDPTVYLNDNPDFNDCESAGGDAGSCMGSGWTCDPSPGLSTPPQMGPPAHINCWTLTGTATLTDDPGLVAVMSFNSIAAGTDSLTFDGTTEIETLYCGTDTTCPGATIEKLETADLRVDKVAVPLPGPNFVLGGMIDYQITVTNQGAYAAPNIVVIDSLPDDKEYNDTETDALNGLDNICDWSDTFGAVICYGDDIMFIGHEVLALASGESATVHVVADIPLDASKDVEVNAALAMTSCSARHRRRAWPTPTGRRSFSRSWRSGVATPRSMTRTTAGPVAATMTPTTTATATSTSSTATA